MNTARLAIMVFMINLVLGMLTVIMAHTTVLNEGMLINIENNQQENFEADFYNSNSTYIKKTTTDETTNEIGVESAWSVNFISLMVDGFNPWLISPNQFDTQIEKGFAYGLKYTRILLNIIFVIAVYILIRNKGQT